MGTSLLARWGLSKLLGMQFGGKRDLYEVFGYKVRPTFDDYLAKYARQDIAKRIVDAPVQATWVHGVEVDGGKIFNTKWEVLVKELRLFNMFERADKLAGIGRYSIILIGFEGSSSLETEIIRAKSILYMHTYSEASVEILKFVDNPTDRRFGLPEMYKVSVTDPTSEVLLKGTRRRTVTKDMNVHWSRILHIAENCLEDNVLGVPRMSPVFNRLDDLEKVVGGSAEIFWLIANRGLHIDVDKEMELGTKDAKDLADEIDEYQHDLRRVIRTRGVKIKTLGSETADPEGVVSVAVAMISAGTGIPRRILLGSEAGQLASEQDRANWADRIDERRDEFAEPVMLLQFINRMVMVEILPEPVDLTFTWPNAFTMSPLEEAQTSAQKARTVINLSKQATGKTPITTTNEARAILGLKDIEESALNEGTFQIELDADEQEEEDEEALREEEKEVREDEEGRVIPITQET